MFKFIERWRATYTQKRFDYGYDYAAGVLLRSSGRERPSADSWDIDAFDAGIRQAELDWIRIRILS